MADDGKGFWHSLPGVLTGIAGVIAAITGLFVVFHPATPIQVGKVPMEVIATPNTDHPPSKPPMGPLQYNIGYEHNDLDAGKWLPAGSPEACSDMCYEREDCKAMTYVISNKSCWLKFAAGNRISDSTEISAVKQ